MHTLDIKEKYEKFIKISIEIRDNFDEFISKGCIKYFVCA